MEVVHIWGGRQLSGNVTVGGAKNACLPILAACLLTQDKCVIHNVPRLTDIDVMCDILRALGASVQYVDHSTLEVQALTVGHTPPSELVRKMRGSVCLMGALLARKGKVFTAAPGGCSIGKRPIDLHLKGFTALGYSCVQSTTGELSIDGSAIHPATINLLGEHGTTMTGTMNVIMAALRAHGETVIITHASIEPEVVDFCNFLVSMGANIEGIGTPTVTVHGTHDFHGSEYTIIGDRIEAGTFACAALITRGDITIYGIDPDIFDQFANVLKKLNAQVSINEDRSLRIKYSEHLRNLSITTASYPGFATDLQAQLGALLTQISGKSVIKETIYPDRFFYARELNKMGADIKMGIGNVVIDGPKQLLGATVDATDLRASAALYLAGLCAKGKTTVTHVFHIDRGYEQFERKLSELGAEIIRTDISDQ